MYSANGEVRRFVKQMNVANIETLLANNFLV